MNLMGIWGPVAPPLNWSLCSSKPSAPLSAVIPVAPDPLAAA